MAPRWLVSVPVWGERYVSEFCAVGQPALDRAVAALAATGVDVRVIAYTDQEERIMGAGGVNTECRPIPAGARNFDCMSQAHRDTLGLALRGDIVVLFNAGTVISEQGLVYCSEVFSNQHLRLILCASPRVLCEGQLPDTGDAQALMDWAWKHKHPMTIESTYPFGRLKDLSRTYFVTEGGAVVARAFLPHPLVVRVDGRPLRFTPTIDCNLIKNFDLTEMHMAVKANRLALMKLTPADKGFELVDKPMDARLAEDGLLVTDDHQKWCAGHAVVLCEGDLEGSPDSIVLTSMRGQVRP